MSDFESLEKKGWRVTPLLHRRKADEEYANMMAAEQRKIVREKKPVTTIQAASLNAIWDSTNNKLKDMTEAEIEAYRNRPMPTKDQWQRETDAEKIAGQLVADNPTRIKDLKVSEDLRRESKNTLGDSVSMGASSVTPESKERARQAFTCTPPASLTAEQKSHLKELSKITKYEGPVVEEWRDLTAWQAFKHWIKGNKVKQVEK